MTSFYSYSSPTEKLAAEQRMGRRRNLITAAEELAAEQRMGRRRNLITAAEELIKVLCTDYCIRVPCSLNHGPENERDWQVVCMVGDVEIYDDWRAFPSEEFMTKLMLLGVAR